MADLQNTKSNEDSTITNIILIVIVVGALWYLFGPSRESFQDEKQNSSVSPDGMMGRYNPGNIMATLTNASDQYDSNASVSSNSLENTNPANMTPDERSLVAMNEISKADSKGMSCNLLGINPEKLSSYKKKFYSLYKHQIECPKNCGLGPVGTRDCYMDRLGMKKCGMNDDDEACGGVFTTQYNNPDVFALGYLALDNNNSKPCATCTFQPSGNNLNRSDIAEDVSVFDSSPLKGYGGSTSSNVLGGILEGFGPTDRSGKSGKKPNQQTKTKSKPGKKSVNKKEKFGMIMENYADLPDDVKATDAKIAAQKNVTEANVSNFVDFENNVYQNSIGETPVDKMAEIRTCVSGTCGLRSYGKSIANVYDKLLDTPAYTNRGSCDPNFINGILEDASIADNYANY